MNRAHRQFTTRQRLSPIPLRGLSQICDVFEQIGTVPLGPSYAACLAGLLVFVTLAGCEPTHQARHFAGLLAAQVETQDDASIGSGGPSAVPATPAPSRSPEANQINTPVVEGQPIAWPTGLERARHRAQLEGKPLLVRAGASWCGWCTKLAEELEKPQAREQLKHWTLVYVDVDESPEEVRQLSIGPIPALRVLGPSGKLVAWHDGYLEQAELVRWLRENLDGTAPERPGVLFAARALESRDVDELVKLLGSSDTIAREAAVRRLLPRPDLAAQQVVEAFAGGKLATRLLALELLTHWKAPVEPIDPWRPETVTPQRIEALKLWTEDAAAAQAPPAAELTADERKAAGDEFDRLLADDDAQALARIEQLARHGAALRPLVIERLAAVSEDRDRERLLTLRYRLAASEALVLGWPGGLSRLASSDTNLRHRAVGELVSRATAAEEPLLLELFADADPLVREISLRGLNAVGTEASSTTLVKLLDDPQPNVRAAVLKQLAESPNPSIVPQISAYLKTETDPDLVVHGVRVLKAAGARGNLIDLLKHSSWQVRAEAAEALGGLTAKNPNQQMAADVYAALIDTLADADPFVVSRAVQGLRRSNLAAAVEPLAKAAADHPELAAEVIKILTQGNFQAKTQTVLRGYLDHADPKVRAEVIAALATLAADDVGDLVERGLKDPASEVRIATAKKLIELSAVLVPSAPSQTSAVVGQAVVVEQEVPVAPPSLGITGALIDLLFGVSRARPARVVIKEKVADADTEQKASDKPEVEENKADENDNQADEDGGQHQPAAEKKAEAPLPDDPALLAFRAGKGRPEWMNRTLPYLEKMIEAEAPGEKLSAAVALIAFGHDSPALDVLRRLVASEPGLLDQASAALPWLPWTERLQLLDELLAQKPGEEELNVIASEMIRRDVDRGVAQLWKLLAADDLTDQTAISVGRVIMQVYRQQESAGARGKPVVGLAGNNPTRYARDGTNWQKNIGLARMVEMSAYNAATLARRRFEDTSVPAEFRRDALQLLLLASDGKAAEKIAVGQIESTDPAIRKLALIYLAGGTEMVNTLRDGIYLIHTRSGPPNQAASTDAVEGLPPEMLTPLLADGDPEVAAAAGCLLALSGDPAGLPPLEKIWRGHQKTRDWSEVLYRSVAALDDDAYTPLLGEINKRLSSWEKRKFYWTIRSMHGPAVLKLRKQIRDEVGMDALR